ncbi:MBL fold metallo-hydrolase [Cupriavidus sp. USMAHM13]|uniref:MBL fold metallo-hydrolase n=1 Tax=Cupriavidus malaysiensis TaxID=367825 RepID=A0ABN4TL62_9BURK|nr:MULTISPECIES: MBL fold metallo-hydrolase [Cupriavidus]AOZ01252.1 MBL fold metallo-hydrolase [Cupriavidus sp. USMAHM13]AOZ08083.1 MBL fold metallo-hydrolase [Cupriavidus malaysiensis]
MQLRFLGATDTVTGSKYVLEAGDRRVMIDCGLFQGYKALRLRNWDPLPLDPASLDAVVLTHAHLDHSGYLPLLVRRGFRGRVYCTEGTARLCEILLADSARLAEEDAHDANRHGYSKHKPALALYGMADAARALRHLQPTGFGARFPVARGIEVEFRHAGHIIGAAIVVLHVDGRRLVFSGDLGRQHDVVMQAPETVGEGDCLLVESTYGNRQHSTEDPLDTISRIVERTAAQGGTLLIPTFAVGRAQSLLYCLHRLQVQGRLPDVPVYLNSPMARDATQVFWLHQDELRIGRAECNAACSLPIYVRSVEESIRLNENRAAKIILAGSGMATGGRILHHLEAFGPDPRNCILLSGFQAGGTRGAALAGGARLLRIHGKEVPINANVEQLTSLSAHADADEILAWLRGFARAPRRTFIVHGEPDGADALRQRIEHELGWPVTMPEYRGVYPLE